jgi:hypothetical protein
MREKVARLKFVGAVAAVCLSALSVSAARADTLTPQGSSTGRGPVVLSTLPFPLALPLFGTALVGMLWLGWGRKR